MKAAFFITGVLILVVLLLNTHMVHAHEGIALLWKERMTPKESCLDVRDAGATQFLALPTPVRDIMARRYHERLKQGFQPPASAPDRHPW